MISQALPTLWHRIYALLFGSPERRGYRLAARGKPAKAAAIWHAAAQAGDADCQLALAEALWFGRGVLRDPNAALRWYDRAARQGRALAQARLAGAYAVGVGEAITRDRSQALRWAEQAAVQGNVEAQVLLAWLLSRNEEGAVPDIARAIDWYRRAVEAGSSAGMVGMAGLISDGAVPEQGPVDAFDLYRRAAELGNKTAFFHLGVCLLHGVGVEPNVNEARRWLTRGADSGVCGAMRGLGMINLYGLGGEKRDMGQAETWLRRAAVKGDGESMMMLAEMHAKGSAVISNPSEAILWYAAAAEAGKAQAQTALGLAYLAGAGVPVDADRAIACFEQASGEDVEALFQLGLCHLLGRGVPVNPSQAADYLRQAAERHHADAAYNYGSLLYNGHGVLQDRQAAFAFYELSAERGSASGQFRMGHALALGRELPEDAERALALFKASAEQGHLASQINLIRMLLKHRPHDLAELRKWRQRLLPAAQANDVEAIIVLAELQWRLDHDAQGALAMLGPPVPADHSLALYVRDMVAAGTQRLISG